MIYIFFVGAINVIFFHKGADSRSSRDCPQDVVKFYATKFSHSENDSWSPFNADSFPVYFLCVH